MSDTDQPEDDAPPLTRAHPGRAILPAKPWVNRKAFFAPYVDVKD